MKKYLSRIWINIKTRKYLKRRKKKYILPLKYLPVDLPPLQSAAPSCINAKTQSYLTNSTSVSFVPRSFSKLSQRRGNYQLVFLTVTEKDLKKVKNQNATQSKDLDKLNTHIGGGGGTTTKKTQNHKTNKQKKPITTTKNYGISDWNQKVKLLRNCFLLRLKRPSSPLYTTSPNRGNLQEYKCLTFKQIIFLKEYHKLELLKVALD